MEPGERQVAAELSGIRRDHVARYWWAAEHLPARSRVLDLACGVGYGSHILAMAHHDVVAIDCSPDAIDYARMNWSHDRIAFQCADAAELKNLDIGKFDAVVCFETIEHLADPLPMLKDFRKRAPILFASVPNEEVFPFRGYKFHHRHYTRADFSDILECAGFTVMEHWGQEGPELDVQPFVNGRTAIVCARRTSDCDTPRFRPVKTGKMEKPRDAGPKHVVILGLGPSLERYIDMTKRLGGRHVLADEVWGINAVGDVIQCDRIFHMDDVRIQEIRAAAAPESNIAEMLKWMKTHPGPIITSWAHADYPGLVEFPLEEVVNDVGYAYFNSTVAYAAAYAIHLKVEKLSFFGCDFSFANSHLAEKGRACLEFWIGMAAARGIQLALPTNTSLMDACEPDDARLYGYDTVKVDIATAENGLAKITFTDRDSLPTAAEIEAKYDHTKHPSPLVRAEKERELA